MYTIVSSNIAIWDMPCCKVPCNMNVLKHQTHPVPDVHNDVSVQITLAISLDVTLDLFLLTPLSCRNRVTSLHDIWQGRSCFAFAVAFMVDLRPLKIPICSIALHPMRRWSHAAMGRVLAILISLPWH